MKRRSTGVRRKASRKLGRLGQGRVSSNHRTDGSPAWIRSRSGFAVLALLVLGVVGTALVWRGATGRPSVRPDTKSAAPVEPLSDSGYTDAEVNAAVNQLFASVNPSLPENKHFTDFAKEKLSWIITEQKASRLSLILLKNVETTNLDVESLMAAARVEDNKAVIVISRPRFAGFLAEGGRASPPFTQQQRNDFALGLVHEAVHLQNPEPGNPANLEERLSEELRAWREVNLHVVRAWRTLNQPMNPRLIEADDALRSCADRLPCQRLAEILLPGERRRQ